MYLSVSCYEGCKFNWLDILICMCPVIFIATSNLPHDFYEECKCQLSILTFISIYIIFIPVASYFSAVFYEGSKFSLHVSFK